MYTIALVAQLVRAPACHAGGCGFEPRLARNIKSQLLLAFFTHQKQGAPHLKLKLEGQNDVKIIHKQ